MAGSQGGQAIPTQLGPAQFEQFVLPRLSVGSRGPAPKPAFRRWEADGCIDAIFVDSGLRLEQDDLLDTTVIHGDGTITAAKKGGDTCGGLGRLDRFREE